MSPNQQHFLNRNGVGNIRHHAWDTQKRTVTTDDWGTGAAGEPVTFVEGTSEHVFARGYDGTLEHWFWDPVHGLDMTTGLRKGLAGNPAAIVIEDSEDVWAVDHGRTFATLVLESGIERNPERQVGRRCGQAAERVGRQER